MKIVCTTFLEGISKEVEVVAKDLKVLQETERPNAELLKEMEELVPKQLCTVHTALTWAAFCQPALYCSNQNKAE